MFLKVNTFSKFKNHNFEIKLIKSFPHNTIMPKKKNTKSETKINKIIKKIPETKEEDLKRINIRSFIKSAVIAFTIYMLFYAIVMYFAYWR